MTDAERIEELEAENQRLREALVAADVRQAEMRFEEACEYASQDMTGQDGEEGAMQAASDMFAARDRQLEIENPDRYSEMQAMGLLR